jgi:hypothetical protein
MKLHINNQGNLTFISKYFMFDSNSISKEFYFRIGDLHKQPRFILHTYDSIFFADRVFNIEICAKFLPKFCKYFDVGVYSFEVRSC